MRGRTSYPNRCNYAVVIYCGAHYRKRPPADMARPQTTAGKAARKAVARIGSGGRLACRAEPVGPWPAPPASRRRVGRPGLTCQAAQSRAGVCPHSTRGPMAALRGAPFGLASARVPLPPVSRGLPGQLAAAGTARPCDLGPVGWPGNPVRAGSCGLSSGDDFRPDLHRRGPVRRIAHSAGRRPVFRVPTGQRDIG